MVGLLEVAFLVVVWLWVGCAALFLRSTVLPRLPIHLRPESLGLPSETVRFVATDGRELEGWKIPATPQAPWVVMCHGLGSNRSDLLDIGAALHHAGVNLFLFDFRGHGGSRGHVTSFGWKEQRDLEGALACLGAQSEVPARPYGVYGISMGGAVAAMVASRDERIGAVAVDSIYTDLHETLARHLMLLYRLPRVPFSWCMAVTYRLRFGIWPRHVSPREALNRLGRRPCLVIHGAEDVRVPVVGVQEMVAASATGTELWMVPGAGHLEALGKVPGEYVERLGLFFKRSLSWS